MEGRHLTPSVRTAPAFVAFAGLLGIPFYFGFIHLPLRQLLVYAPVAGVAMTIGIHLDRLEGEIGTSVRNVMASVSAWTLLTVVMGGTSYLVALAV